MCFIFRKLFGILNFITEIKSYFHDSYLGTIQPYIIDNDIEPNKNILEKNIIIK